MLRFDVMQRAVSMVAIEALKLVKEKPRLTPAEIAKAIGKDVQYTRNVLSILQELKLVELPARGVYTISQHGEYLLKRIAE